MEFILPHLWEIVCVAVSYMVRKPVTSLLLGIYYWLYTKMGSPYFSVGATYSRFVRKLSGCDYGPCYIKGKDFFLIYLEDAKGNEFPVKKHQFQFDFDKIKLKANY